MFFDAAGLRCKAVANLYPSPRILLDSYVGFFENLFAAPASEAGIDRWGMKTVRCSADHVFLLRWLFPQSKPLFLIRNPYDAFRETKAPPGSGLVFGVRPEWHL